MMHTTTETGLKLKKDMSTEFVKDWQLNIKAAVARLKNNKRRRHTFNARNIAGTKIFEGWNNSKADSIMLAHQEAILK